VTITNPLTGKPMEKTPWWHFSWGAHVQGWAGGAEVHVAVLAIAYPLATRTSPGRSSPQGSWVSRAKPTSACRAAARN